LIFLGRGQTEGQITKLKLVKRQMSLSLVIWEVRANQFECASEPESTRR
jgi:hypothetical protein